MADTNKRMTDSLENLVAGVPGEEILVKFKECLLTQNVFKKLFGENGERIIIDKTVSLNTQIVPLLELRWKSDSQESYDTYLTGQIDGRMVFPSTIRGANFNVKRRIALMLLRFIGSDNFELWDKVPGLRMFGNNAQVNYSVAFNVGLNSFPGILITLPYQLDIHQWHLEHPEIDPEEALDGEEFSIESYGLNIQVEKDGDFETVITEDISNEE